LPVDSGSQEEQIMRNIIIAGNWKMHKTIGEAVKLVNALKVKTLNIRKTDVVVCPPYLALKFVADALKESNIQVGAQNVFWEKEGAFTGEISPGMLLDAGCTYVIIGHSERRQYFGETDATVNKRLRAALQSKLRPILCVGETLAEREAGNTFSVIGTQLEGGLRDATAADLANLILAYEPVWAIGTGRNAAPEQAEEVHRFIRRTISDQFGEAAAAAIRIQYGGSVKPANAEALLRQSNVDGALVGGASLDADRFIEIVKTAEKLQN